MTLIAAALLSLCVAAGHAEPGYTPLREFAQANDLEYKDLSEGVIHAAKIIGRGHEAILFADLRNIVIDGASALLAYPVKWDGSGLIVPAEAIELLRMRMGLSTASAAPLQRLPYSAKGTYTVVIDPGHGGKDPGAISRTGLQEKEVNLDVSRRLGAYLQSKGVKVIFTRHTDVFVPLEERAATANRVAPDLFISIHTNSDLQRSRQGAMSLYPDDGLSDGRPGVLGRAKAAVESNSIRPQSFGAGGPVDKRAFLAVAGAAFESYRIRSIEAAHRIQKALGPVTGHVEKNNGIIEDFRGLRVLRMAQVPAVLVEVDFLSNRASEQKLWRTSYRSAIAKAIGEAVMGFLQNEPLSEVAP